MTGYTRDWDPCPSILMNRVLSLQVAYTGPIIHDEPEPPGRAHDRLEAHDDYVVNQKAEVEIRAILDHLIAQSGALEAIHGLLAGADRAAGGAWGGDGG